MRIHVIEPDYRRRARVVHEFAQRNMHAEVYEDVVEFARRVPGEGCVFVVEDEQLPAEGIVDSIRACGAALPIVLYSDHPTPEKIVQGMLAGALDYLQWPFEPEVLERALARLGSLGPRHILQERLRLHARKVTGVLSPREREVLVLMTQGMSNKEMANALDLSPRTVELHRNNMMRRLDAHSPSDAVRLAIYAGLDEQIEGRPGGGEVGSKQP